MEPKHISEALKDAVDAIIQAADYIEEDTKREESKNETMWFDDFMDWVENSGYKFEFDTEKFIINIESRKCFHTINLKDKKHNRRVRDFFNFIKEIDKNILQKCNMCRKGK